MGLGRAPAVTMPASAPSSRARAACISGLKYSPASESVCKSQLFGGQGETACPRLFSTNDCNPASPRFRDSKLAALSAGTTGAARYLWAAQPPSEKLAKHSKIANAEFMEISLRTKKINSKTRATKLS